MFKTVKRIISWAGEYKKRLYLGFLWSFLQTMFTALPIMGAAYFLDLMIKDSRGEIEMRPVMALYALIFMAGQAHQMQEECGKHDTCQCDQRHLPREKQQT